MLKAGVKNGKLMAGSSYIMVIWHVNCLDVEGEYLWIDRLWFLAGQSVEQQKGYCANKDAPVELLPRLQGAFLVHLPPLPREHPSANCMESR